MSPRGRPSVLTVGASTLFIAVFAGCIADTDDDAAKDVAPPVFVDPMALAEGHDHGDYAMHQMSWNMHELGWTQVVDGAPLAWGEVDIEGTRALVAHAWPTAGVALVDVSDASTPTLLDHWDFGYGYGADVKWSPDGHHAIVAVQAHSGRGLPVDPLSMITEAGVWILYVNGDTFQEESFFPLPGGGSHMVYTHTIAGRDYVFAVDNGRGVMIFEMVSADTHRLVPVTQYRHFEGPTGAIAIDGPHDMMVIDDPLLGKPLLYVSDAYQGLVVADISDPQGPVYLGGWRDTESEWYAHTAQAEVLADGTRRIVLAPEVFSDAEANLVAPLWILDGTDLGDIRLDGTWQNPGDHGADLLRFSVHNFQLLQGKIVLAHYHGGVWVIDADTREAIGYHLPANDPGHAMSGIYHGVYNMEDAPTVWDVNVRDGVVWATDVNSGLYAITTPSLALGDANATSLG